MFLGAYKVDALKTMISKNQCEIFNLVGLMQLCWQCAVYHESMMPLLSFSHYIL